MTTQTQTKTIDERLDVVFDRLRNAGRESQSATLFFLVGTLQGHDLIGNKTVDLEELTNTLEKCVARFGDEEATV